LRIVRLLEADEREAHDAEIDELRRRDEVHEPLQHNGRVLRDLKEREQSQGQHDQHTVDRDALSRAAGQEARCLALESGPEQRARRAVDIAVPGRKGRREHHGVDDVRQHVDLKPVHGNDIYGEAAAPSLLPANAAFSSASLYGTLILAHSEPSTKNAVSR